MTRASGTMVTAVTTMAVGFALLALYAPEGGLRAEGLFGDKGLCIVLDGQEVVQGTIDAALLPGDVASGELEVGHCDQVIAETLDVDIDFRSSLSDRDPPASPTLLELLAVEHLQYGADDLLHADARPGDRNLMLEIDANPVLGNGDGLLSLDELEAGINDLPAPPAGGTVPFSVGLRLVMDAGNEIQGDTVAFAIVFFLSDEAHGDLN